MIEYLYNAIRATAGEDVCVCSRITDDSGNVINNHAHLMLYDDLLLLDTVDGSFDGKYWDFVIPGEITRGLKGRYWYCICVENSSLCFKQPIYFT